ncbi:hypothetical protein BDN71DRAFT_1455855 [Pleurotus eryngii]|uniref:MICOS complex subunit MIC60 n=1 Tax=Pleurotus eryngii TaxID=5323 RepID=A0A9P6D3G3_PLEER|nr:hypothetical protein BDN71DRAFT_1455855 [Pleurotus eryngii]
MYRALPSRRVASSTARGLAGATRRRLATEASPSTPKKKRGVVSRIFWYTATLTGTFYVGSTFVSFKNQQYYDFFSDHVPLGQPFLEYAETHHWDKLTVQKVMDAWRETATSAQRFIAEKVEGKPSGGAEKVKQSVEATRQAAEKKVHVTSEKVIDVVQNLEKKAQDAKTRVHDVASDLRTSVKAGEGKLFDKATAIAQHQSQQVNDELLNLIHQAEAALSGKPIDSLPEATTTPEQPAGSPPDSVPPRHNEDEASIDRDVYTAPLPVGFEPPPGYKRPAPPKSPPTPKAEPPVSATLPLVAPVVSALSASEPIIVHLATTIDDLASYLKSNPSAASHAKDVLELAKSDLTSLVDRIEKVKEEERVQLEEKMDEQTREYSLKMMELEMEAQDKLDGQEETFRKFYDEEQMRFAQIYREKLEQELATQTEIINERLKQEVIAQGIELQRRWIREIKVRVEEERGGRLAKLDELAANLKRLERIALDNTAHLDDNIRIHALWSAFRALNHTVDGPVRRPFRDELRALRHVAAAREDPVVTTVLDKLDASDVPDVGVEPLADLASWFTTSVAPKVSGVALVPDENAGLLSYVASHFLSSFRFKRQGLVEGDDVLSVLARAEYHLNEKDLDGAARELNQLKGTAKILLQDWLEAARRRLEVQQALEVVQAQATLSSLLVV